MPLSLSMPSIETALLVGRAVFLLFSFVIAAIAFTRWRRAAEHDSRHIAEQSTLVLERLASLESRISATHSRIQELAERVDSRIRATEAIPGTTPAYSLAIRLARNGASCDELVTTCGITRQEAELVLRLHAA